MQTSQERNARGIALDKLRPGMRIRVTHTIRRRNGDWTTSVTGRIVSVGREKTGSWYAHSPKGRLLLNRVHLRKDDGELAAVNLDELARVEILGAA